MATHLKKVYPYFNHQVHDYRTVDGATYVALKLDTYVRKLGEDGKFYLCLVIRNLHDCPPESFKDWYEGALKTFVKDCYMMREFGLINPGTGWEIDSDQRTERERLCN